MPSWSPWGGPRTAHAVGEQNGRITGVIIDKLSQAPLPGAKVTVKSGALIGGPLSTLTGEDGSYELNALPPGTYDVELAFAGANSLRRRVAVRQDETFPLTIEWSVGARQRRQKKSSSKSGA